MKYLLCVYTCDREPYTSYLQVLHRCGWFRRLLSDPDVRALYVYADPSLTEPRLDGDRLTLPVPEEYSRLAAKTYEMIRYCVAHEEFDYLVKIDESVVGQYFGWLLHWQNLKQACRGDYGGSELIRTTNRSFAKFGRHKGIGNVAPTPHAHGVFFKGKHYYLSRRACEIIAERGKDLLPVFLERIGGAEDAFIGKVLTEAGVFRPQAVRRYVRQTAHSLRRKFFRYLWLSYKISLPRE